MERVNKAVAYVLSYPGLLGSILIGSAFSAMAIYPTLVPTSLPYACLMGLFALMFSNQKGLFFAYILLGFSLLSHVFTSPLFDGLWLCFLSLLTGLGYTVLWHEKEEYSEALAVHHGKESVHLEHIHRHESQIQDLKADLSHQQEIMEEFSREAEGIQKESTFLKQAQLEADRAYKIERQKNESNQEILQRNIQEKQMEIETLKDLLQVNQTKQNQLQEDFKNESAYLKHMQVEVEHSHKAETEKWETKQKALLHDLELGKREIQKVKSDFLLQESKQKQVEKEAQTYQAQVEMFKTELAKKQDELENLNRKLVEKTNSFNEQIDLLRSEKNERTAHLKEIERQLLQTLEEKQIAQQQLQTAQTAYEALQNTNEELIIQMNAASKIKNVRHSEERWDALYRQLRVQFEDKQAVLEQTRKELFHTHEELLVLRKEVEEERQFSENSLERMCFKQLIQCEKEAEKTKSKLLTEIGALEGLVSDLFKEIQ